MSLHKTDRILSELPLPALPCLLYRMVSSLMNAFEGEYLCLCEISLNVNKFIAVLLLAVLFIRYLFFFFLYCTLLLLVYIFIPCLYFCLFVDHVSNTIIYGAFVCHFKNTISVTILTSSCCYCLAQIFNKS